MMAGCVLLTQGVERQLPQFRLPRLDIGQPGTFERMAPLSAGVGRALYLFQERNCAAPMLQGFGEVGSDASSAVRASIKASADQVVSELRSAYVLGAVKIGVISLATPAVWTWVMGTGGVQSAIIGNYRKLGQHIQRWATVLRDDADRGYRLDDSLKPAGKYDWERWSDAAKVYADAVVFQTALVWSSNPMKVAISALVESAKDLEKLNPATPGTWPTWLKVLVGFGALGVGAYALNSVTQAKRTFAR